MSVHQDRYTVCDQCLGVIPSMADRIGSMSGTLVLNRQPSRFEGLDFCSTQHMLDFIAAAGAEIPVPSPAYPRLPPAT